MRSICVRAPTPSLKTLIRAPVAEHEPVCSSCRRERCCGRTRCSAIRRSRRSRRSDARSGEVDADRERRVAEQVAAAVGVVLAGVLGIDRERRLPRKHEAADVGRLLVALSLRQAARLEEIACQESGRVRQAAARRRTQQPIDAERPARNGLDRELRAEQAGVAAASTPL